MSLQVKKTIVLGVTGGIAAYKTAELVRLLVKADYEVHVVMTQAAHQFTTPTTMQALSGNPVLSDLWDSSTGNGMPHIALSRKADAILIAPASADFLAKLAQGRADDLLSTLCLARDCPLLVAPAMNKHMWENKATQRNISQLKADAIEMLGPDIGEQACGENGFGRMLEVEALLTLIKAHFTPKLLTGKRILMTAGATLEMIDPVRGISNLSSGKMGYAIAQAALDMGAQVTLVSGMSALTPPHHSTVIKAQSAHAMYEAVMSNVLNQDIFIAVAAVADYRPVTKHHKKIKKSNALLTIELTPNKDILADVASLPTPPFCVGFAAETENLLEYAETKRKAKKLALIVANLASDAMGSDENQVVLLDESGVHPLARAPKTEVAKLLLQHIAHLISPTDP